MSRLKASLIVSILLALLVGIVSFFVVEPHQRAKRAAPQAATQPLAQRPAAADVPPEFEADTPLHPNAPRFLFGQITNEADEQPVAGAMIEVIPVDGKTRTVRADHAGRFKMRRVPAALESIRVTARGFEERLFEAPELPIERRVQWDVALVPKPTIHGVVRVDGRPVEGATVRLVREGRRLNLRGQQTGPSGRFSIRFFENGPRTIEAAHGQHGRVVVEITGPGEYPIDLPGGGYIAGRVVDEHDEPVVSFSISASPMVTRSGGPPAQSFEASDGRFLLGPLMEGELKVWAAALGYQPTEQVGIKVMPGETVEGIVLRLKTSTQLRGRVTDAQTGRPIEGAEVIPAAWRAQALAESVGAWTDAEGRYQLTALPGVRTSVKVKAEGYRDLLLGGVEGRPGEDIVRDFSLTPAPDGNSRGELTGIGAVLRPHRDGVRLGQIMEDGPAAGVLEAGDIVTAVNGRSARKLGMTRVAESIRGEEGTEVVLTVKRGRAAPLELTLVRGRVQMPKFRRRRPAPVDSTHNPGTN